MDSRRYKTPVPNLVGRKVPNDGPVTDPSSPDIACNVGGEDGTGKLFEVEAGSNVTVQMNTVRPSAPTLRLPFDLLLLLLAYHSGLPLTWVLSRLSWRLATEIVPTSRPLMVNGSRSVKVDTRMDSGVLPF